MEYNESGLHKLEADQLSLLTGSGQRYLLEIMSAVELLQVEYSNETLITNDDNNKTFKALNDNLHKYMKLIRDSVKERQNYFDLMKQQEQRK